MKKIALVLMLGMLALLSCSAFAEGEPYHLHNVLCTAQDVCVLCGKTVGPGENKDVLHSETLVFSHDSNYHFNMCPDCGQRFYDASVDRHTAPCTAPDKCETCGATKAEGAVISVYHGDKEYGHNSQEHWEYCVKCGQEFSRGGHTNNCLSPNWCRVCFAQASEGAVIEVQHGELEKTMTDDGYVVVCTICHKTMESGEHRYEYRFDSAGHWYECIDCGDKQEKAPHTASCASPGVCQVCGAKAAEGANIQAGHGEIAYTITEEGHTGVCKVCGKTVAQGPHEKGGMKYSSVSHWYVCPVCGFEFEKEDHTAPCSDASHCAVCGASASKADIDLIHGELQMRPGDWGHGLFCTVCHLLISSETEHEGTFQFDEKQHWIKCVDCQQIYNLGEHTFTQESDDEYHWKACEICGAVMDKAPHAAPCTSPDACALCGAKAAEGAEIDIQHGELELGYDDKTHYFQCPICGEKMNEERHRGTCGNDGKCAVCGALKKDGADVQATDHRWLLKESTAATCEREGGQRYQCAVCGLEWTRNKTPAFGHRPIQVMAGDTAVQVCAVCSVCLDNIKYEDKALDEACSLRIWDLLPLMKEEERPLMAFCVSLSAEGAPIAPFGKMTVTLDISKLNLPESLSGAVLYRIDPAGGYEEIPFEILAEEHLLRFETEALGVFQLLPETISSGSSPSAPAN